MKLHSQESGQGLIEYLIIVVVIAVGAIAIMKEIRTRMHTKLEDVEQQIIKLKDGGN